jgi:hypothetical protein
MTNELDVTEIKVGPIIYEVKEVANLLDADGAQKLLGNIRYKDCSIQIEPDQNFQSKRVVLIHEALHAVATQGILNLSEEQIEKLAYGVAEIIPQIKHLW